MAGATAEASAKVASTSVFQLAWPVMVANLLQTLTTTVDVIMVGSLGSEAPAAVAAVGFGGQFIFLFFSVMISVSAGTIALVARAIGANRLEEADHVLKESLVLGALLSIPLTLFGLVFAEPMLAAFGAEAEVVTLRGAYFRIGLPAALEQILLQVAFLLWVRMVVVFGTEILAAHQIGLRIQSFAFMPGFGFAIAATALVGQNLGARDAVAAERSGWEATKFSVAVMSVIAIVIFLLAEPIARGFIGDPVVVSRSVTFIRIHPISIPAVGIFFAIDGALRGAGDTRFPLMTSLSGMYAVRLPLSLVFGFVLGWGIVGAWIPLVIEYYYRSVVIVNHFHRGKWKALRV